jgi:hypothetical protein
MDEYLLFYLIVDYKVCPQLLAIIDSAALDTYAHVWEFLCNIYLEKKVSLQLYFVLLIGCLKFPCISIIYLASLLVMNT